MIWRIFYLARMLTASEAAISAAFHTASAGRPQNSLASTADASVQFGHPFMEEIVLYIKLISAQRGNNESIDCKTQNKVDIKHT